MLQFPSVTASPASRGGGLSVLVGDRCIMVANPLSYHSDKVIAMSVTTETATIHPMLLVRNNPPAVTQAKPDKVRCTLKMIDVLEGNRSNTITVLVANPKKPGSIAHRNFALYDNEPTVAGFLNGYPRNDGGKTRARASLLWDIERGFVGVKGLTFETKV